MRLRRTAAVVILTALIGTGAPSPAGAQTRSGGISVPAATALAGELGEARTGGVYVDQGTGRTVVTVTDDAAARAVTDAGGLARQVAFSTEELEAVNDEVARAVTTPGTAFGVEVPENQVVIDVDSTVDDATLARIRAATDPHGAAVRIKRHSEALTTMISGGEKVHPRAFQYGSCSVGFNVRKKSDPNSLYMITAGHCTVPTNRDGYRDWENAAHVYIGYTAGGFFPGNDFGLIRHYNAGIAKPGTVYVGDGVYRDITHSRDPGIDEAVCSRGFTSGYTCGRVLARGKTVNYAEGTVTGLIKTNLCRGPGDSGGPLFTGDAALGLLSGGLPCETYYQPVNEALAWYGVEVY